MYYLLLTALRGYLLLVERGRQALNPVQARRAGRRGAADAPRCEGELAKAYRTLGLRPGASKAAAKRAYHELAKKCHPDALRAENVERIEAFRTAALAAGIQPVVYGPTETYETADWKSLLTLNRSNGGAVYFNDGTIVAKWANSELPKVDLPAVLQEDPDVLILKHRIREQLYVSILIAGVLVLLVLMRVLCKLLIKNR